MTQVQQARSVEHVKIPPLGKEYRQPLPTFIARDDDGPLGWPTDTGLPSPGGSGNSTGK